MRIRPLQRELIEKFLLKVPIFHNCSRRCLGQIVDNFRLRQVPAGQYVMFQTEKTTDLHIILNGKVKVTIESEDGEEYILTHLGAGDFFGEMSLIDENPRSANVVAEENSLCAVLQRDMFLQAIKDDPVIAIDLLSSLVKRLRRATDSIACLAFLDVRERLLNLFRQQIESEGKKHKSGYYEIRKRTQRDLATSIGASRESVAKILKVFISRQDIVVKDGCFLICPRLLD